MTFHPPGATRIREQHDALASYIVETPVMRAAEIEDGLGPGMEVYANLEFDEAELEAEVS